MANNLNFNDNFKLFLMFFDLYTFKSGVTNSVTFNTPFVKVPVLSVRRTFILPDVSIPTSFLTKTLSLSIFFILLDKTKVIIIGRPSGTATTMIVTDKVKA